MATTSSKSATETPPTPSLPPGYNFRRLLAWLPAFWRVLITAWLIELPELREQTQVAE